MCVLPDFRPHPHSHFKSTYLQFSPTNLYFFLKIKTNFGFFLIAEKLGIFFLKKKRTINFGFFLLYIQMIFITLQLYIFWIFFRETWDSFPRLYYKNSSAIAHVRSVLNTPTRTHFRTHNSKRLRTSFAPNLPHTHVRSHLRTHAH